MRSWPLAALGRTCRGLSAAPPVYFDHHSSEQRAVSPWLREANQCKQQHSSETKCPQLPIGRVSRRSTQACGALFSLFLSTAPYHHIIHHFPASRLVTLFLTLRPSLHCSPAAADRDLFSCAECVSAARESFCSEI